MKTSTKRIIITLVFSIPALLFGKIIWPPSPEIPPPTPTQLPFFMFLAGVEALVFGFGVGFLMFGWRWVKRISGESRTIAIWTFVAISWLLVSWWPHDNLHMHNGMNLQGLLYIEYGFHVTLIIASLIVTRFFYKLVSRSAAQS